MKATSVNMVPPTPKRSSHKRSKSVIPDSLVEECAKLQKKLAQGNLSDSSSDDSSTSPSSVSSCESPKKKRPLNKWMLFLAQYRKLHGERFKGKNSKLLVKEASDKYKAMT